jgi:hypothetical protein
MINQLLAAESGESEEGDAAGMGPAATEDGSDADGRSASADADPAPDDENGILSQEAIHRLLDNQEEETRDLEANGEQGGDAAPPEVADLEKRSVDETAAPEETAPSESETLSQDAISRLLAEADMQDTPQENDEQPDADSEESGSGEEGTLPETPLPAANEGGTDPRALTEDEDSDPAPAKAAPAETQAEDPAEKVPADTEGPQADGEGAVSDSFDSRDTVEEEKNDAAEPHDAVENDQEEAPWRMDSPKEKEPSATDSSGNGEEDGESTFVLRKQAQPLRTRRKTRIRAVLLLLVLALVAGSGGWYYWTRIKPSGENILAQPPAKPVPAEEDHNTSPMEKKGASEATEAEPAVTTGPADLSGHFVEKALPALRSGIVDPVLEDRLASAGNIRDELLIKREEIIRLRQYFVEGAAALEAEIRDRRGKTAAVAFDAMQKDPRQLLALQSVYRRRDIIGKLAEPIRWLELASEELNYAVRRTRIDLKLLPYTEGRNTGDLLAEMEKVITTYSLENRKLEVSPAPPPQEKQLKALWLALFPVKKEAPPPSPKKPAGEKSPSKPVVPAKKEDPRPPVSLNREIAKELCRGNYRRKSMLTEISSEAAGCLAKDSSKDLFLNGVEQLTPEAAARLAGWKGEWLTLNGLKDLTAESAQQLARWKGERLSLNGLTTMSPIAARKLTAWGGKQLELIGLDIRDNKLAGTVRRHLQRWEKKKGRKLYLSSRFMKQEEKKK